MKGSVKLCALIVAVGATVALACRPWRSLPPPCKAGPATAARMILALPDQSPSPGLSPATTAAVTGLGDRGGSLPVTDRRSAEPGAEGVKIARSFPTYGDRFVSEFIKALQQAGALDEMQIRQIKTALGRSAVKKALAHYILEKQAPLKPSDSANLRKQFQIEAKKMMSGLPTSLSGPQRAVAVDLINRESKAWEEFCVRSLGQSSR